MSTGSNPGHDEQRPPRALPARADLRFLKDEAKRRHASREFASLSAAQFALAREHGFVSWPRLKQFLETRQLDVAGRAAALVRAACSNDVRAARAMLAAEPELARFDLWTACACGEADAVAGHLAHDPSAATRKGGPLAREPILYACFSRFLRADPARAEGIVRVVRTLLGRGADPNSYYLSDVDGSGKPLAQHCIYAAAGIANNVELTRMLFDAGAVVDAPGLAWNDALHPANEVVYHAAEFTDTACLKMVLDHRPPADAVHYCIGRALDYEHPEAVAAFLRAGADPNYRVRWKGMRTQAHKAVVARRSVGIVKLLLDAGADPNAVDQFGVSMLRSAVRTGQRETAELLIARGADAASVTDDDRAMGELVHGGGHAGSGASARRPSWIDPDLLTEAASGNDVAAIDRLLDAGAPVDTAAGADAMPPLHWACWRGNFEAARRLVERGADLAVKNRFGSDALGTAIHGSAHCFDEGGPGMKLPEEVPPRGYARIVEMLIARGARLPETIGDAGEAVREMLRRHGVREEDAAT